MSSACTPGCGRCWPASPTRPASCPASTPASQPVPGLVIVAGGKYTTYRVMAEDAINEAVKGSAGTVAKSCTDKVPLIGADGYKPLWNTRATPGRAHRAGRRRGSSTCSAGTAARSSELLALMRANPNSAAAATAPQYLKVEAQVRGHRTRARCTWTTSWPAGPDLDRHLGPRRSPPPRRSPTWSHRYSGWDAAAVDREVEHYRPAGGRRTGVAAAARRSNRRRRPARGGRCPGGSG